MIPDGVGEWIRRRAVARGEHPAIVFLDRAVTYAELADRIDRCALALRRRGIEHGDRVAYLGENHPSFVETLFACARIGAIMVPLNTRLAVAELTYMLEDCGAALLVSSDRLEAHAAAAAQHAGVQRLVVRTTDDAATRPDRAEQVPPDELDEPGDGEATPDDPLLILYTSGTTGRPKGAVLSHGAVTWNALNVLADYDVVSRDRALMISPLFHVASLGMGCLPILLKGATVLLEECFVPAEALRSIERLGATTMSGVPTTYQLMAEEPAWASTDLTSLRLLTCGGSPVSDRVREAFESRGLAFSGGYGMTEAGPGVTMLPPEHSIAHGRSVGIAHSFTQHRIRTLEGALATAGETGEIEVRGPNLFSGYWERPEETAEAFTADGWFRTGDIGYRTADGFLYIADRLKDMIISGGENVYSAEVERAILTIEGVTGAAVLGVPHERWGEVPHAVVTVAPDRVLDPEELVAHLSGLLARYKVPRSLEVVDELPMTASGKIRKAELRERFDRRAREAD